MARTNSEIEEYYFEKFRTRYVLPEGQIAYGDKPDVKIIGNKTIGIEITNFYTDRTGGEQSQINMRLNTAQKAQKSYQDKHKNNIEFTFSFNRDFPIKNVGQFSKTLALLAERLTPHPIGWISREHFVDVKELSFVWRGKEYDDCEWKVAQPFTISMMNITHLEEIIREKEEKAAQYQACDANWLLIIVDFINLAQSQEISNAALKEIQSDIFEKVIIYKTVLEQIVEVPIIFSNSRNKN